MSKVLFIGHYRENSGWGHGAIDYIMAMDRAGINIVPRCVKLGLDVPELPQRILELENQDTVGCDVCVQYVLPHLMDYNGNFKKNIGMYTTETDTFEYSGWVQKLNTMDELWVSCKQMKRAAQKSGVSTPTEIVHYPTDVSKFEREYERMEIMNGDFIFYFIGDLTVRKNLIAFLKAYHLEFSPSEPVSVLLKTRKHGKSAQENQQNITEACNTIKEQLKLYPHLDDYKAEILVTDQLTEENLARLHVSCDCFVASSFGEAWGIPAFDALGYGNPVIANDVGGLAEFVTMENGWLCSNHKEPVFGMADSFHDLFTGYENWASIDIDSLRTAMRVAYEDKSLFARKKKVAAESVYDFSYEKVGLQMKGLLCQ